MDTYKIIRHFKDGGSETVDTGLTLEEAQDHCSDDETSSETCTSAEGLNLTKRKGSWFDGYTKE